MSSSHYPSFYSHHYEKCDDEEDEELEVIENRLIYGSSLISLLLPFARTRH